jgi:hypothetical protein
MNSRAVRNCLIAVTCLLVLSGAAAAQNEQPAAPPTGQERARDGIFEITLKTPDKPKLITDELVRDRDLDPGALYRVRVGGYLAFDESEWVDKIEFKLFEKQVTELAQYRRYSELLSEINQKIWELKQQLDSYDMLALRMMNLCDRSTFPSFQAIDENVLQQLTIYKKLVLLRSLVVNSLDRVLAERGCADKYTQYKRSLELYARSLSELAKSHEMLAKRALAFSEEIQSGQDQVRPGRQPEGELKFRPGGE